MPTPVDPAHDLVLLLHACSAHADARVLAEVRRLVGDDVRTADGYVFQHLLTGDRTVTELAGLLGVSQQAASKQVIDMEQRGLVERRAAAGDARMTIVVVTRRGRRVVSAGRRARRRVADELTAALGPADGADLLELLRRTAEGTGALEHLVRRRLRPDRDGGAPVSGGGRR